MLKKILSIFLVLLFLSGCSLPSLQTSGSDVDRTSSTESFSSTEWITTKGTVEDASMNSLLIRTEQAEYFRFSTENAQMELGETGLLLGQQVEVTYLLSQADPIPATTVRLLAEEISAENKLLINILHSMTLEEKVAQMFFVRCPAEYADQTVLKWQIGGFILFGRDFSGKTPDQLRQNIADYQQNAKTPLFIGADEEGGEVIRASRHSQFRAVPFPSPQDLYAQGGLDSVLEDAKDKSSFLLDLGINVNLAPVCDVSVNPADYIYKRTLGKDARTTASYIEAVVQQMQKSGIGSVLKHFPGYGPNGDTHLGFVRDDRPMETFLKEDFLPFQAGIDAGAPSILVSHNIVSCMDSSLPASLSPVVHQLLRENLKFDGVILTDDLSMNAICSQYGLEESAVLAVQAGNDMIISTDFEAQIPAVLQAVQDGTVPQSQIDNSVLRILRWKQQLGLLTAEGEKIS